MRLMVDDVPVWGVATLIDGNYVPTITLIYSGDWGFVQAEFGIVPEFALGWLTDKECASIVGADENNTPDEAWAALAKWKLMQ